MMTSLLRQIMPKNAFWPIFEMVAGWPR